VFHGLRHTYASDLVRAGATLDVVARQLGHANTRTVSDTYGHLSGHFREEQVQAMFSPLSPKYVEASEREADQLAAMRDSFGNCDWRDYGKAMGCSSQPAQAYRATAKGVLQVFESAEGQ
jgi:predicted amidohydrolase YtcJ